jgi:beta-1,4-mannosyl-glycoprotein beta-1,4-N-acetylglucosaminyltransferase
MKIFDVFMFNNELDLLEIRLEYMYPVIDYFIITEADKYFNGQKKSFFLDENWDRFKKYKDKIIYNKIINIPNNFDNFYPPHKNFIDYNKIYEHKNFNTCVLKLKKQFHTEVYIRDSQILGLVNIAKHDDIIISSDLDEFVERELIADIRNNLKIVPKAQHLNVECHEFIYNYNFKNKNKWYGPKIFRYDYLNEKSFDLLRYPLTSIKYQIFEVIKNSGYHFTTFGNLNLIKHKLASASFNGSRYFYLYKLLYHLFPSLLKYRIKNGKNYFFFKNYYEKVKVEQYVSKDLIKLIDKFMKY